MEIIILVSLPWKKLDLLTNNTYYSIFHKDFKKCIKDQCHILLRLNSLEEKVR